MPLTTADAISPETVGDNVDGSKPPKSNAIHPESCPEAKTIPFETVNVDLEMNKIALAAMSGEAELKEAIEVLVNHFDIESQAPTPIEVAKDMQQLIVDCMSGNVDEATKEDRLATILTLAMEAQDPLDMKQSQEELQDS